MMKRTLDLSALLGAEYFPPVNSSVCCLHVTEWGWRGTMGELNRHGKKNNLSPAQNVTNVWQRNVIVWIPANKPLKMSQSLTHQGGSTSLRDASIQCQSWNSSKLGSRTDWRANSTPGGHKRHCLINDVARLLRARTLTGYSFKTLRHALMLVLYASRWWYATLAHTIKMTPKAPTNKIEVERTSLSELVCSEKRLLWLE